MLDNNPREVVIHEARQRFVATFSRQCDTIAALIEAVAELGSNGPIDSLRRMLHNIAGHAGGIGFPNVGAGAATIEAVIADELPGDFDSRRALELVAALRDDFATDLVSGPADTPTDPGPATGTGKILVVDDDAQAREGLTEYLIATGYSAIGLPAAESLLDVARDEHPDLILLDIGLPGIDGFAACRLLKTAPDLSHIPVIFLTGHTEIDNRLTGLALGAEEFLSKPVDVREVKLRIQLQLARREHPGSTPAIDDRRHGKSSYAAFMETAREALQQSAAAIAITVSARARSADAHAVRLPRKLRVPPAHELVADRGAVRFSAPSAAVGSHDAHRVWNLTMKRGLIVLALLVLPAMARAQADVIALARTAAEQGRRVEALTMLEQHLAQSPGDVDARLVYGLVLSWEGRYDEARRELQRVLTQAPDYMDARTALTNVDLWSRRRGASGRGWTANVSYSHDRFSDDRGSWHEQAVSLSRSTPIGSIVVRGTRAARFSLTDEQVDVELYPAFRAGTYAYVGLAVAPDAALYPHRRGAFDLYQSLGRGLEVSAGYRGLEFEEVTHIYVVTLTKYVGTWMATGKVYHVPGRVAPDSTSYHGVVRRYFGADGTSFAGFGYGHGVSREEVRSLGDFVTVAADTVRGQVDVAVTAWWRLQLEASTSRQEQSWGTVWQTTLGTGLSRRF